MTTGVTGRAVSRAGVVAAAAGLAVAAALLTLAVRGPDPGAGALQDPFCSESFPVRLFPDADTEAELRQLVVCTNRAGTATSTLNGTRAVWVLDTTEPRPDYRLPSTDFERSFLDLVGAEDLDLIERGATALPTGATVISLAPSSETRLRVDARLTVAQLVYYELLTSLDSAELHRTALATSPSSTRRALGSCVHAILGQLGLPESVLRRDPVSRIAHAAGRVAAAPASACALDWLQAKVEWGDVQVTGTQFADDVLDWGDDRRFASFVRSAADTYRVLTAGAPAAGAP